MSGSPRSERPLPEFDGLAYMSNVLPHLRSTAQPVLFPDWQISDGRMCSVRNRTYGGDKRRKSSALFRYDLSLTRADGRESARSELHLKAFLNGRGAGAAPGRGDLAVAVPELDAHAWIFPGDPRMGALPDLLDPDRLRARLPREHQDGQRVEVERLRYKPEDRCTLRITVHGPDGPRPVIAKVFASDRRAEALHRIATDLHQRCDRSEMAFRVPAPVALDRTAGTFWISELPGHPPDAASIDRGMVGRIATALALFHRSDPLVDQSPRTVGDQLVDTEGRVRVLADLFPVLEPRLTGLVKRLEADADRLGPIPVGNVHGAFRLRQLIVADAEVGLIDFDSLAIGDPTEDLVDMMLDLGPGSVSDRSWAPARFLAEYQAAAEADVDRDRLRWQIPVQLLKRAYWLRHAAQRRPILAAELARRVDRACDPRSADLADLADTADPAVGDR